MRGGAWRRAGVPGDEGEKQEVAGRVAARTERMPLSSWREEGDDWHGQLAGPACWAAGPGRLHSEVSAGGFSSFPSIFVFCNLF